MGSGPESYIFRILLQAPGILIALTVHEFFHGWMANRLGDPTARMHGRLTLNPLSHLDPMGTILLFVAGFGWAKPVPFNPFNLRNFKTGTLLIALAGPASNFVLAAISGVLTWLAANALSNTGDPKTAGIVTGMLYYSTRINLVLAFFNLIPFPPLDGSKILFGLIPREWEPAYAKFERIGPILLGVLIFSDIFLHLGLLSFLFGPLVGFFTTLFTGGFFS